MKTLNKSGAADENIEKPVYIVGAFTPFFQHGHTSRLSHYSPVPLISFLRKGRKAAKKAISYRKRLYRPTILWSLGLGEWVDILAKECLLFKGIKNVQTGREHWEERTGMRW